MRPTCRIPSPVVTFMSRDPLSSQRTQSILYQLVGMEPIHSEDGATNSRDALDDAIFSPRVPLLRRWRFDSAASVCPASGTVLHLLSVAGAQRGEVADNIGNELALLSISGGSSADGASMTPSKSVREARRQLAAAVQNKGVALAPLLGIRLAVNDLLKRPAGTTASHSLCSDDGLPWLDLPPRSGVSDGSGGSRLASADDRDDSRGLRLREVVLPFFEEATYSDGATVLDRFAASGFFRPRTGLYSWPRAQSGAALTFRPLPSAVGDRSIPPPSLVFQLSNLSDAASIMREKLGARTDRVGFTGGHGGQLMVRHRLLGGLDVRLCDATDLSSSFAEAQEALMAGSLDELQSSNVLVEGGGTGANERQSQGRDKTSNAMNGAGDCWIEFRANLRRPSGFLKTARGSIPFTGKKKSVNMGRVVKAPDIPYE